MKKRVLTSIMAALSVLGIAGCVGFQGEPGGKQIGPHTVRLSFKICVAQSSPNCTDQGNNSSGRYESLIALRVPKGSDLPNSFKPVGKDVIYTRDSGYGKQLKRNVPTPEGTVWVGFRSQAFQVDPAAGLNVRARFAIKAGLPSKIGKIFRYSPVLGYMQRSDESGAADAEPIRCQDFDEFSGGDANATCADAPAARFEIRKGVKIPLQS